MEIMRTHDIAFTDRHFTTINSKLLYNCKDVALAPYSEYWRQMKSICNLFSSKRIQSFKPIREEETAAFMAKIVDAESTKINLSELLSSFSNDMICRVAFGRQYAGGEAGKKFKTILDDFQDVMTAFDIGEYVPWLSWLNNFNGLNAKVERVAKEMDELIENILVTYLGRNRSDLKDYEIDFVDPMLELQEILGKDALFDKDCIKAVIQDMFVAGTDTTFTVLEWAMTELLRHPSAMKKTQEEIRAAVANKCAVSEAELHESRREGSVKAAPTCAIDCSNILHKFDWKLREGVNPEDVDILETSGLVVRRQSPLLAVATCR